MKIWTDNSLHAFSQEFLLRDRRILPWGKFHGVDSFKMMNTDLQAKYVNIFQFLGDFLWKN